MELWGIELFNSAGYADEISSYFEDSWAIFSFLCL